MKSWFEEIHTDIVVVEGRRKDVVETPDKAVVCAGTDR